MPAKFQWLLLCGIQRNTASIILQFWPRVWLHLNLNSITESGVRNFASCSAGYYSANIHAIKVKLGGDLALPIH